MKQKDVPITANRVDTFRPTFGETFPDLQFEAVTGRDSALELHAYDGTRFWTSSRVEHRGRSFAPAKPSEGLARAVRFPTSSEERGSATELIKSMQEFLCKWAHMTLDDAALLAAFALSTWFVDCFPRAPCLHLTGSNNRAILVMRLLACLCRRPLLVGRLDLAALATLPEGLNPTLLVFDANLAQSVSRTLEASRNRDLAIPVGKTWLHAYGARVLFSNSISVKASDLRIHLASTTAMPELRADEELAIAADYTAKLLRYRFLHFKTVHNSAFEVSQLDCALPGEMRSLLLPLIDCPDFRGSVSSRLVSQHREVGGERFTELDCLTVEAALCFCHDPVKKNFLVNQLTEAVNALLIGRHEDGTVTAKAIGHVLRGLGLFTERVASGYRLVLTNKVRVRIHRLALEYNVASLAKLKFDCNECKLTDSGEHRELCA